jgi:hypothetical protein
LFRRRPFYFRNLAGPGFSPICADANLCPRANYGLKKEPALEQETWSVFQSHDDKEWSYTHCALLALSKQLKIAEVCAFDDHFRQMPGIKCLPH